MPSTDGIAGETLWSRFRDTMYKCYCISHIPPSFMLHIHLFWPPTWPPSRFVQGFVRQWIDYSHDPLWASILNVSRFSSLETGLVWFRCLAVLEAAIHLPIFIVALFGLYRGSKLVYPLLLAYGASAATATLACCAYFHSLPTHASGNSIPSTPGLSDEKRMILYASYLPYLVVPLIMVVDMGVRIAKILGKDLAVEKKKKKVQYSKGRNSGKNAIKNY